jgi:hypothetical protein
MWKANGKSTTLLLFLRSLFPKTDKYEMLPVDMFLEETPRGRSLGKKEDKEKQKVHHSIKIETWNVRTLNQGGNLKNLKKEMKNKSGSVLGVSKVQWKGHGLVCFIKTI